MEQPIRGLFSLKFIYDIGSRILTRILGGRQQVNHAPITVIWCFPITSDTLFSHMRQPLSLSFYLTLCQSLSFSDWLGVPLITQLFKKFAWFKINVNRGVFVILTISTFVIALKIHFTLSNISDSNFSQKSSRSIYLDSIKKDYYYATLQILWT